MTASRRLAALSALALTVGLVVGGCGAMWVGNGGGTAPTGSATTDGSSAPIPVGSSTRTLEVGGLPRSYLIYRPAQLAARAPLVMMLHGGFGSGAQAESSYGWDAEADIRHFVVVYPDGDGRAWNVGGGCCGTPGRTNVDDVAFLSAVVGDVQSALPIDHAMIYATGISNGGMMAYRLACDTKLFAAIGPDSATLLGDCPTPHPVSVIAIHGTADQSIPYNGGVGSGVAKIDGPSIPSVNQLWRVADSCSPPTTRTTSSISGDVATSTASCPNAREVELITIAGAGHQWPGSVQVRPGADTPYPGLDATAVIWAFFAAHPAA